LSRKYLRVYVKLKSKRRKGIAMENKYTKILLSISRINALLKNLTSELDKVYANLTDEEILDMFNIETARILPMEDFD
jgi:hypothetical protein